MGQGFHENAHNRIDLKKYSENWDHIFGKKCKHERLIVEVDHKLFEGNNPTICADCEKILEPKDLE